MNIEQLKLIIEMLNGLGAGTKDILMLYLGAEYIVKPLFVVLGIAVALWGVSKVILAVTRMSKGETNLQEIRDRLGVGTSGCYTDREHYAVLNKINELKQGETK